MELEITNSEFITDGSGDLAPFRSTFISIANGYRFENQDYGNVSALFRNNLFRTNTLLSIALLDTLRFENNIIDEPNFIFTDLNSIESFFFDNNRFAKGSVIEISGTIQDSISLDNEFNELPFRLHEPIYILENGSLSINNSTILFEGSWINVEGKSLSIKNSLLAGNSYNDIRMYDNSFLSVDSVSLKNLTIEFFDQSSGTIRYSDFDQFCVVDNNSENLISAADNWWDSSFGPTIVPELRAGNSIPFGTVISDNIDYIPVAESHFNNHTLPFDYYLKGNYGITFQSYDGNDDWDSIIQNVFGSEYRVADWKDLQDAPEALDFNELKLLKFDARFFLTNDSEKSPNNENFYFAVRNPDFQPDSVIFDDFLSYNFRRRIGLTSGAARSPILAIKRVMTSSESLSETPTKTILYQNYPNPFNPTTNIKFSIFKPSKVTLEVFDITGRSIVKLVNSSLNSGNHTYSFEATGLSSGVYIYTLTINKEKFSKKMLLIK